MAVFSSETLISDGDFIERAGVVTEAGAAGGGGVGGEGDVAEAAEEEAEFGGVEIEADAAPALFPPFFFFVMMGDADVLKVLKTLSRAVVEQQLHLERLSGRRESARGEENRLVTNTDGGFGRLPRECQS